MIHAEQPFAIPTCTTVCSYKLHLLIRKRYWLYGKHVWLYTVAGTFFAHTVKLGYARLAPLAIIRQIA